MISGVLLDISGVIYEGEEVLPGALDAIARLRKAGLSIRFLTNTTRSSKRMVLQRLAKMGVKVSEDELFTPAAAAREWLQEANRSPVLLVHSNLIGEFEEAPQRRAKAVVIGDAGEDFTYANLNRAFRALIDGAKLIALAKNRTFKDADGKLSLDAGAFVSALEYASGLEALVLGKPSKEFFKAALSSMDCPPEQAVMVGDDAEADVAGALSAGIRAAVLVQTGKYREGDESRYQPRPTVMVTDLSEAANWIVDHRQNANYQSSAEG